jgi:hypothetical protein
LQNTKAPKTLKSYPKPRIALPIGKSKTLCDLPQDTRQIQACYGTASPKNTHITGVKFVIDVVVHTCMMQLLHVVK